MTFTLIRWKQLYYLGVAGLIAALAFTAWNEHTWWYNIAAAFLGACVLISLWQFATRIRGGVLFTLDKDGVHFPDGTTAPWSSMRRIQNLPSTNIVFFFMRDGKAAEKNCNCRGMNVEIHVAMYALKDGYSAYLMREGAADQARKMSAMFEREALFP